MKILDVMKSVPTANGTKVHKRIGAATLEARSGEWTFKVKFDVPQEAGTLEECTMVAPREYLRDRYASMERKVSDLAAVYDEAVGH